MNDLSRVEFALRRMVKQLLHGPTVRAKELAAAGQQGEYIAALQALYGIEIEAVEPQMPAAVESAESATQPTCPVDHDQSA